MKKILVLIVGLAFGLPALTSYAETFYPQGYSLAADYQLSGTTIAVSDTLVITRTLSNNESFVLDGLYFTEYLPVDFLVTEITATINGQGASFDFDLEEVDVTVEGYRGYRWILDLPPGEGGVQNSVDPGESVVLSIHVTCGETGQYQLPLHSTSFYGQSTGFFATGEAVSVTFGNVTPDTTPPAAIDDLH